MKNKYLLIFLALILLPSQIHAENVFGQSQQLFKVGAIIPLTGPLSDYGDSVRKSFEYSRRLYPERFANIEFIYQDSAYDGKTAINALQSLMTRDDIDLYYTWRVTPNESVLPIANARKLPVIAETSFKSAVVGKPYAVRAAPTGEMTARILSSEIKRRGYRQVGVIVVDIPYYHDILSTLKSDLSSAGIQLKIIDTVASDFNDFKSLIAKARLSSYDALGIFLLNDQIVTWYKQALALKYVVPTFGAGIHDSLALLRKCGAGAEGVFFAGYDVEPSFQAQWLKEFHDDSRIGSIANAFDTSLMIAELFGSKPIRKQSAEELISRFSSITSRSGVSGRFSYQDSPDSGKSFDFPVSLREFKGGGIVKTL
jgi:ABC-type branched-subunit amino acid transport system substrate-binding protein